MQHFNKWNRKFDSDLVTAKLKLYDQCTWSLTQSFRTYIFFYLSSF